MKGQIHVWRKNFSIALGICQLSHSNSLFFIFKWRPKRFLLVLVFQIVFDAKQTNILRALGRRNRPIVSQILHLTQQWE